MDFFFHLISGILLWACFSSARAVAFWEIKKRGGTIPKQDLQESLIEKFGPVIAAILPDIDIFFYQEIEAVYYTPEVFTHRTFTHGLEFIFIVGLLFGIILLVKRRSFWASLYGFAFGAGGIILHRFLDEFSVKLAVYNKFFSNIQVEYLTDIPTFWEFTKLYLRTLLDYLTATFEGSVYLWVMIFMWLLAIFLLIARDEIIEDCYGDRNRSLAEDSSWVITHF